MNRKKYMITSVALLTAGVLFAAGGEDEPTVNYWTSSGSATTTPLTGAGFALSGTAGQPDAGLLSGGAYELTGGFTITAPQTGGPLCPGGTIQECADADGDGIRDDGCLFWECNAGMCEETPIAYADMGGSNGACPADGTADGNDRFHALNCFSNQTTTGEFGYPCEAEAPAAYNVDAAGLGAPCRPDGVCDGNDAFAALNAFSGTTTCSCPSGAAPSGPGGGGPAPVAPGSDDAQIVDSVTIELLPSREHAAQGDHIEVDVYITGGVTDLRGYQLHPGASKGLKLVDMLIDDPKAHVFAGQAFWDAYNLETQQMVVGIDADGIASSSERLYLATLVYEVVGDGTQRVDLRYGSGSELNSDPAGRSFLFPTPAAGTIEILEVAAAVITVDSGAPGRQLGKSSR